MMVKEGKQTGVGVAAARLDGVARHQLSLKEWTTENWQSAQQWWWASCTAVALRCCISALWVAHSKVESVQMVFSSNTEPSLQPEKVAC